MNQSDKVEKYREILPKTASQQRINDRCIHAHIKSTN